jgi:hypothetical protein
MPIPDVEGVLINMKVTLNGVFAVICAFGSPPPAA